MDNRRRSRRELFSGWLEAVRERARTVRNPDVETLLRPPGALSPDEDFLERCSGCGDCLPVCPADAIFPVKREDGRLLPAIAPARTPCYLCDRLPCVEACPDGALIDPGGPERVRIGIAKVDPRRCVTFRGQRCDRCHKVCPYPDRAIMMIGLRPLVNSSSCTGCGLCEHACPEEPKAIQVVAERLLVPGLRVPKSEYNPG